MSNNQTKKLLCYSHEDFDHLMFKNGWSERPPRDVAIISIASHLDENPYHHFMYSGADNVLNIDFCDCTPEEWWGGRDRYDELFKHFEYNFKTIWYNKEKVDQLGLSQSECFACISHELGHFLDPSDRWATPQQTREINADQLAVELGLRKSLQTALDVNHH